MKRIQPKKKVILTKKVRSIKKQSSSLKGKLQGVFQAWRARIALGFICICILSINTLTFLILYQKHQSSSLSFETTYIQEELSVEKTVVSEPIRIQVEAQQIDLPIQETQIKNGIWETPKRSLGHLGVSAKPGENGNVVIYGHNTGGLFGRLPQVKVNDKIALENKDGQKYEYIVTKTEIARPHQVEAVLPTEKEVLTLYTCTGFLDSQRFIVRAIPSKEIEASL